MAGELDGKVAIVTGGAAGIGRATVELFVAEGARVVIADIDEARGAELAAALGEAVRFQRADVAVDADIQALVDLAVSEFGGLHIMFNNAGVSDSDLSDLLVNKLENFGRVLDVNLRGVVIGTQLAARHMARHGGGSIINTSSIAALQPGFGFTAYRSAKAAVIHFSKCAAIELGTEMIRVNCICPGNIPTDMGKWAVAEPGMSQETATRIREEVNITRMRWQALKRQGAPIDVAETVLFLASDRGAQLSGLCLPVDGGTSLGGAIPVLPDLLDARARAIAATTN